MLVKKETLDFLQDAQKGWYDGVGEPLAPEVIQYLLESEELPVLGWAYAYLTLEGNVSLEWDSKHTPNFPEHLDFIDVELSPSKATLFYGGKNGNTKEVTLPLEEWVDYLKQNILEGK